MKYLCLVYNEEKALAAMSKDDYKVLHDESMAAAEEMAGSGHLIAAEALQHVGTATTVRIRDGRMSTTDGPFAETKEQLGGFYLIDARDLNEAIGLAAKIPSAHNGAIEVRPISEGGCRQPPL